MSRLNDLPPGVSVMDEHINPSSLARRIERTVQDATRDMPDWMGGVKVSWVAKQLGISRSLANIHLQSSTLYGRLRRIEARVGRRHYLYRA